ncbi:MAG: acyl-CoA dehydrogenase family protein [Actinomycetota bacterium]|nr:acyl-CoA dehydrogenase family protein [Actinomycetota bacterium]
MSQLDWSLTEERLALAKTVLDMSAALDDQLQLALDESGMSWIGIEESEGGSGGDDADLAIAIRALAGQARNASLAETAFVSAWALRQCGHSEASRHIAPAFSTANDLQAVEREGRWWVSGTARQVPATSAAQLALLPIALGDSWHLALLPISSAEIEEEDNLAGEIRTTLRFNSAPAELMLELPAHLNWIDLHARLGLARAIQISGALLAVRDLTVSYARTREQFGKPIAEQQAVAHMLASVAEQALLAEAAVATAISTPGLWNNAIAKSVTSRAARSAAATAHQVHGAMGMSEEYPLGALTTRLWSWAEEGGRAEAWENWIGRRFMEQDQPQLWESIVNPPESRHQ